jgi:peptidoglycan/xylan/chitin deacetylase (PgdA/CDA1 family)
MNSNYFKIPLPLSFGLLRKKAGINPLIVNYHVVSDENIPYIKGLYNYRNKQRFCADLDFLAANYHPIGLVEFLDCIEHKKKIPDNAVMFTIDDGFREVYEIMAPILLERNLTATVFLTSGFVDNKQFGIDQKKSILIEKLSHAADDFQLERTGKELKLKNLFKENVIYSILNIPYVHRDILDSISNIIGIDFTGMLNHFQPFLTTPQITELIHSGFTIGGHSIDHPNFMELSTKEQVHQAKTSVDFVTEKFAVQYKVFAFPYWDGGVSKEFFADIHGHIEATFGTQGMMHDVIPDNFQRISVEKYPQQAKRIIKANYLRKILYHALNKDSIQRPDA